MLDEFAPDFLADVDGRDSDEPVAGSGVLSLRTVAGAGALPAAAVTAALAARRTLQRRRRRPGEKIATAQETAPTEALLAAAAEPLGTARLDVVLRTMAHGADRDGQEVPRLRRAQSRPWIVSDELWSPIEPLLLRGPKLVEGRPRVPDRQE
ncbi:hypothetical protein [Streptomyces sp. NPDC002265]|uniref:hypothetical protein n=1 Tax=Streptomyces sp. NPDC002265 TaxID=3154415 RepID=UPI00332499BD